MIAMGIDKSIIKMVNQMLNAAKIQIEDKVCDTNTNVPTGSILSPTLFNIYLADLVKTLNEIHGVISIHYADDCVLVIKGDFALFNAI